MLEVAEMLNEVVRENLAKDNDSDHFNESREKRLEALKQIMQADLSEARNLRRVLADRAEDLDLPDSFKAEVEFRQLDSDAILHHNGRGPEDNFRQLQRVATEQYIKYVLPRTHPDMVEEIKTLTDNDALREYLKANQDIFDGLKTAYKLEGEADNPGLLSDDSCERIREYATGLKLPENLRYSFIYARLRKLIETNSKSLDNKTQCKLKEYMREIDYMHRNNQVSEEELSKFLFATEAFLLNPEDRHESYTSLAKSLSGQPSLALKILGGIMLAVGALMIGLGFALSITPAAPYGLGVAAGGVAMAGSGFCFFNAGKAEKTRAIADDIIHDLQDTVSVANTAN